MSEHDRRKGERRGEDRGWTSRTEMVGLLRGQKLDRREGGKRRRSGRYAESCDPYLQSAGYLAPDRRVLDTKRTPEWWDSDRRAEPEAPQEGDRR